MRSCAVWGGGRFKAPDPPLPQWAAAANARPGPTGVDRTGFMEAAGRGHHVTSRPARPARRVDPTAAGRLHIRYPPPRILTLVAPTRCCRFLFYRGNTGNADTLQYRLRSTPCGCRLAGWCEEGCAAPASIGCAAACNNTLLALAKVAGVSEQPLVSLLPCRLLNFLAAFSAALRMSCVVVRCLR